MRHHNAGTEIELDAYDLNALKDFARSRVKNVPGSDAQKWAIEEMKTYFVAHSRTFINLACRELGIEELEPLEPKGERTKQSDLDALYGNRPQPTTEEQAAAVAAMAAGATAAPAPTGSTEP